MMLRAFRDKWVELCTDGSFICFRSHLINADNHKERCCLGVALGLAAEMGLRPPIDPEEIPMYVDSYNSRNNKLTEVDREAMGLSEELQNQLAQANDDYFVREGQYYPQRVVDLIKAQPVKD